MSWEIVHSGGTDIIAEVTSDKKIKAINMVKVTTQAVIDVDATVVLKKDGINVFKGIIKKRTSEDEVMYQYDVNELVVELADYVLYEGLKTYEVAGQTIDQIVNDVLNFTPSDGVKWVNVAVYETVTSGSGSNQLVLDNRDIVNGDLKFEINDQVRFSGIPPTGLNVTSVYYVVAATETYICVSLVKGGTAIVCSSISTCNIHHVVRYMSVYWGKRLNALYKVVTDIGGMSIWFDSFNKTVGYGYLRVDRGDMTENIYQRKPEDESYRKNYDKVIVLGSKDTIRGTAGSGNKVVVYRYEDANTIEEAEDMAKIILKSVGDVSRRLVVVTDPSVVVDEGDVVTIDGVRYCVFDVKETYESVEIGVGAIKQTVFDKYGEKLKEVTGEVSTGSNATYDGGLQNIGAPSVNAIVSVDMAADTFTVADVELYYSNGDRVVFSSKGTVPSPLVIGTVYYVRDLDAANETFKVAATSGGAVINLTTNGSGIIRARNLDSQSIPAEFVINVPDRLKIGKVDYIADFSAYRDQMSIGDEVEFLSVPSIVSVSASGSNIPFDAVTPRYLPSSAGQSFVTVDKGFQFGRVKGSIDLNPYYDWETGKDNTINASFSIQVSHDRGTTWTTVWSGYGAESSASSTNPPPYTFDVWISGSSNKGSESRIRMVLDHNKYYYVGHANASFTVECIPRHNHIIDKQNNVLQSTLAKNVKCYITNSAFTDKLIYTWNGTINGEKPLTNLYDHLRDGQNILKFFSEEPGSVYVSGTYESYGI